MINLRKIQQWIAIQEKKGGPALVLLQEWEKENAPKPRQVTFDIEESETPFSELWTKVITDEFVDAVIYGRRITPMPEYSFASLYEQQPVPDPPTKPHQKGQYKQLDPTPRSPKKRGH